MTDSITLLGQQLTRQKNAIEFLAMQHTSEPVYHKKVQNCSNSDRERVLDGDYVHNLNGIPHQRRVGEINAAGHRDEAPKNGHVPDQTDGVIDLSQSKDTRVRFSDLSTSTRYMPLYPKDLTSASSQSSVNCHEQPKNLSDNASCLGNIPAYHLPRDDNRRNYPTNTHNSPCNLPSQLSSYQQHSAHDELSQSQMPSGFMSKSLTPGVKVGDHVDDETKQLIWDDKFIDLVAVLTPSELEHCASVKTSDDPNSKPKRVIKDIRTWNRAMNTFITVYLKKHQSLQVQRDLATYVKYIWDLQEKGFNWLEYDTEYRRERADEECKAPWSMSRQHLFNQLMLDKFNTIKNSGNYPKSNGNVSNSNNAFKSGDKTNVGFVPRSYCFAFHNKGKFCPGNGCTYNHECPNCHVGVHPAYTCKNSTNPKSNFRGGYNQSTQNYTPWGFQQFGFQPRMQQSAQHNNGMRFNAPWQYQQPMFYQFGMQPFGQPFNTYNSQYQQQPQPQHNNNQYTYTNNKQYNGQSQKSQQQPTNAFNSK